MALTRYELVQRVELLWGQEPYALTQIGNTWSFTLTDGSSHSVDGNGHVTCHAKCKKLECKKLEWEQVAANTKRLKVPGGWLYKSHSYAENTADVMCFVPYYPGEE